MSLLTPSFPSGPLSAQDVMGLGAQAPGPGTLWEHVTLPPLRASCEAFWFPLLQPGYEGRERGWEGALLG